MLLQPRSTAEEHCEGLKVNVDDLNPRRCYICSWNCFSHHLQVCLVPGAQCGGCRKTMIHILDMPIKDSVANTRDGVFASGGARRFMVSDDFRITAASTTNTQALLQELGITDGAILEERDVEVGQNEILSLLERFLQSKTPLSEVFLGLKQINFKDVEIPKVQEQAEVKIENDTNDASNCIDIKLVLNKENDEVLYAEANGDFINVLFSFLTFPLGLVVKLLDRRSSLECSDNLYRSVNDQLAKSDMCKAMLLSPKIAPHFGINKQILKIDESPPETVYSGNPTNPKLPDLGTNNGGGFVNEQERFMVTSDLVVKPMSAAALINITNKQHAPITSIEERIINFGEAEALKLLKASLVSHNAFSSAFSVRKRRSKKYIA